MSEPGMKCYKAILTYEIEVPCYGHDEYEALADATVRAQNFGRKLYSRDDVDIVETVTVSIKGET